MRVALFWFAVVVVGCKASSDKAARQASEPPKSGAASSEGGGAPAGNAAQEPAPPPPSPVAQGSAPPGGGPPDDPKKDGRGVGGLEEARNAGMLGPADQRAFQTDGKVTIKKFSSKDLDAIVKTKLDALHECYVKALEFHETLAGEITITVKDGAAKITGTTVKHADLEKCVIDALAGATLPKAKATLVLAFKRS
jgi:hypothetical protein